MRLCDRGRDFRLGACEGDIRSWLGRDDLRLGRGGDELLAREALGRLRTHLVEADDDRALRRARVEPLDDPLFSAKSGSTRSPNQVS
jgi:hypothetical protein